MICQFKNIKIFPLWVTCAKRLIATADTPRSLKSKVSASGVRVHCFIVARQARHLSFFVMGHTSRCPGCKIPKSKHTFAKASKDCQGAPRPDETDEVLSATGLASGSTTVSRKLWLRLLEPFSLLQPMCSPNNRDNQALWDKVEDTRDSQLSPSSAATHPLGIPLRVTLPELRDMKELVSQVDSRV